MQGSKGDAWCLLRVAVKGVHGKIIGKRPSILSRIEDARLADVLAPSQSIYDVYSRQSSKNFKGRCKMLVQAEGTKGPHNN